MLKIICTPLVMFSTLMFKWEKGKKKKKPPSWLYFWLRSSTETQQKYSVFKTNCDRQWKWKVNTVCNMEWKRSWNKRKELPPATQKTGFYPKKVTLCIWWDWKWILNYDLLLENQMITSNMYCSQLDQVKAAFDKKKASRISQQRMHNLPSG